MVINRANFSWENFLFLKEKFTKQKRHCINHSSLYFSSSPDPPHLPEG